MRSHLAAFVGRGNLWLGDGTPRSASLVLFRKAYRQQLSSAPFARETRRSSVTKVTSFMAAFSQDILRFAHFYATLCGCLWLVFYRKNADEWKYETGLRAEDIYKT